MTASTRTITLAAAVLGFIGVALGAAGAHGKLHDALVAAGALENWKTAVLYQLIHAVALLGLAGWRDAHGGPSGKVALLWTIGAVFFCGSIYVLALGGPKFLGPVTPLGGVSFLAGWALLAASALKRPAA